MIEAAITPKTKAIMLAHALGNPFNVGRVKEICDKYNLWLVEDTCDALGAEFNGQKCGTFGRHWNFELLSCTSHDNGRGRCCFMNSSELKIIAESFRDWEEIAIVRLDVTIHVAVGLNKNMVIYLSGMIINMFIHIRYNLKITDMQAACGLAQLGKLNSFIEKRRLNYNYLRNKLEPLSDFIHLPVPTPNSNPSWFVFQ